MANIPKKVKERIVSGLKRFQPVISSARSRDVNEADTVTIVTDILSEIFGYDKYSEITSEYAIRGTYSDLAIEIDGSVRLLLEVKAVGINLKNNHLRQVVDYAANKGTEWVALTNGIEWKIYRVLFKKPIDKELVLDFNFLELVHRSSSDLDCLYLLTREGRSKSALKEYHIQRQAMNRHSIGAILLSDPVLSVVRRELKKIAPKVKIQNEELQEVIMEEVLKREVVEGEKAEQARKKVERKTKKPPQPKEEKQASPTPEPQIDNPSVPLGLAENPKAG